MSKSSKTINPQIDRFKEAAKKLGADESEAAFDERLKKIATQRMPVVPPKEKA